MHMFRNTWPYYVELPVMFDMFPVQLNVNFKTQFQVRDLVLLNYFLGDISHWVQWITVMVQAMEITVIIKSYELAALQKTWL